MLPLVDLFVWCQGMPCEDRVGGASKAGLQEAIPQVRALCHGETDEQGHPCFIFIIAYAMTISYDFKKIQKICAGSC